MDTTSNTQPATQAAFPNSTSTRVEPLEALVQSVVSKYQNIEILHPLLEKLFESSAQKELFTSVTQHDYNQLMTRSQKLEDHEVNVYEKAFCVLMEREEDRIGGLEIYMEKILGVGDGEGWKGEEEREAWMMKGVAVRALLERGELCISLLYLSTLDLSPRKHTLPFLFRPTQTQTPQTLPHRTQAHQNANSN